jgi:dephospho-CoA kinase
LTRAPILIGLTGGPGVGKSEAARYLAKKGATIIQADSIGHELLQSHKAARSRIMELLGRGILDEKANLNRRRIGSLVFNSPELMIKFNAIVHPLLLNELKKQIKRESLYSRARYVVVDAALIYEWGIANWFDVILVVTARRDVRLKRLGSMGFSLRSAARRIASQIPQRDKTALADWVIENNSTRKSLYAKVDKFVKHLNSLFD